MVGIFKAGSVNVTFSYWSTNNNVKTDKAENKGKPTQAEGSNDTQDTFAGQSFEDEIKSLEDKIFKNRLNA